MTVRLFVYGTLAPGDEAWPVLEPWVVGVPQRDAVAGSLYDTGRGYPAATFAAAPADSPPASAPSLVHGMLVTLDPGLDAAALVALDRYEGDEYERIEVRTEAGLDAATYAWIAPLTGCRAVPGGWWRGRPQTETPGPGGR